MPQIKTDAECHEEVLENSKLDTARHKEQIIERLFSLQHIGTHGMLKWWLENWRNGEL